jgi:hypothetical protein
MTRDVKLADAVKQLREQLEEAQRAGSGQNIRFLAKSVEVELNVVFKSEVEGGAGLKAWFLEASAKTRGAEETTHRLRLVLEPVGLDGKPTPISDRDYERE